MTTGTGARDPRVAAPTPRHGHGAVLATTCLALATVVAATASLNVALPSIAAETRASQTQLSWIVDAYALTFAALLLAGGAIGDRAGRRRVLVAGLLVFGTGSAVAMTVDSAPALIALRAVLGLGAALVMPATLATVTTIFPAAQRAKAVGTWAGVAGASAVVGLLASGLVLEHWSWRGVFGVNVALAAIALVATLRVVPESADPDAPRVDVLGALVSAAGLAALVYSIIEAPTAGWWTARTLGGLAAGAVLLALFAVWETRTATPLLDVRLFGVPAFGAGVLSLTLQFAAFFGFVFLVLQYLQLVLGNSPLVAAASLVPMALGMMPSARLVAPRLADRFGTAHASAAGLVLAAAALGLLSRLDERSPYWLLLGGLVALGAGMGLAMTPATAAVTDALPADKQGVGSAMNDVARELGGALGIAVLGSILLSLYRGHLPLPGVPHRVAEHARESLAVARAIDPSLAGRAQAAFVDGMQVALATAAGMLLLAACAVIVLRRGDRDGAPGAGR
ncbi:drug resistance transporter, EmrB/QacA subfamily [Jatrophihabitans endophyticus]|uniref:Drug resistance transporter, EmrB/QacA subfamily n=1 Tax=Jatrophihabitans endophyticus TaxID=1206085 RepID=A0A1M5LC09_9ACTN|nr:MFS transporter [Jatrophihabitans endophyticus]SHG62485.1 drug resistance transporter, EmrB/QacA subfamily [Jatrophihabitans endophyticus]